MSIALSQKVKELERRIAELEHAIKGDPDAGRKHIELMKSVIASAPPGPNTQKRKPGRPPKNG